MGGNVRTPDMQAFSGVRRIGRALSSRELSDQFLNQQFGWVPFLSDVSAFTNTFLHADDIVGKISHQNGQLVRRRVSVYDDSQSDLLQVVGFDNLTTLWPVGLPEHFIPAGLQCTRELIETTSISISAMGAFRYYRPEFDPRANEYWSALNQIKRQMTIYGLRISPINLYRAYPWTWALDWISNASDYLEYVSDMLEDSLCAAYFYLMARKEIKRTVIWTIPFASGVLTLPFSRTVEIKQRIPASSPFDFGLSWRNLSPRQLLIAAALGITRA
jgi:hypothetical protein